MIVSRKQAEEAALALVVELDGLTPEMVKLAYRAGAARAHPDRGGTAEQFVVVDRAKCILEAWLAKPPADAPKGLLPTACPKCGGTGRTKLQRGFRYMMVLCQPCNGTGDADLDKEKHNGDR